MKRKHRKQKSRLLALIVVLLSLCFSKVCAVDWYNANWFYRVKLTVESSQVNANLTNYPVYVNLSNLPAGFFSHVLSSGADIRVTKSDGTTEVARELVELDTVNGAGEMHFVANGTLSSTTNTEFYIYYGYASATAPADSDTYGAQNVWLNYSGVWHMNDPIAVASPVLDSTSNSNDGTTQGSMTNGDLVTGKIGKAFDFDGTDDYVDIPDSSSLDSSLGTSFTISAWMKTTASTVAIFSKYKHNSGSNLDDSYYLGVESKKFRFKMNPGNSAVTAEHISDVNDGSWHHVVGVFGSGTAKEYVDTANNQSAFTGGSSVNDTGISAYIAATIDGGTTTNYFASLIDEVRVHKDELASTWISTEYNNQSNPSSFYSVGSEEALSDYPPVVISFSPPDDSTTASQDTNLVIVFDKNIDIKTGNVTIKKYDNDAIVEVIDVTGGLVTGNGTTTITINPINDLNDSVHYYVQIDSTAFEDEYGNNYAGIADNSTWDFTVDRWWCGGIVPSGEWDKRIKLTVNEEYVNGDLTNFPIYVDLGDMPASFFTDLNSDGSDIRVTTEQGTPCAVELVDLDTAGQNGEMHFKAPMLYGNLDTDFWIYYDCPTCRSPNPSSKYGSYSVWDNGYVAVYHLQENPSGTSLMMNSATKGYYQLVGLGSQPLPYHGEPQGSMTSADSVPGQLGNGKALDFDGTDDYISSFSDIEEIDGATQLTYSLWFKRESLGDPIYMGKGETASATNMTDIAIATDGQVYVHFRNGGTSYGEFTSNKTIWEHLFVTYDGTQGSNATKLVSYYNGTAQALSFTGTIPSALASNSNEFLIGKRHFDSNYSNGLVDEVRVATKVRDPDWMVTEYNNQRSPRTFYTIGSVDNLTTLISPRLTQVVPSRDATNVSPRINLQMIFNGTVTADTGNITIYDESDDSVFETISCVGGQVTGSGSTTIVINPLSNFTAGKTYYVMVDSTCFYNASADYFLGIAVEGAWQFSVQGSAGPHPILFDSYP